MVDSNVKMEHSNVNRVTALQLTSDAMGTETVETYLMKLDVRHDSLVADIVQRADSNVQINCACHNRTFVMEQMIAATGLTRLLQFAPILIAIRFDASIVTITVACLGIKYVMV